MNQVKELSYNSDTKLFEPYTSKRNSELSTFNRLHNVTNPYQGKAKKVLCLCSAGLLRSPTTAVVLQREFGYNTRAAGVSKEYALIEMDEVLLSWADEIVAVEQSVANQVPVGFIDKLTTLSVPDKFPYMDPELQQIILTQYRDAHG